MNWKKAFIFIGFAIFIFMADAFLKAYIHFQIPPINASPPVYPYGGVAVFRGWHGIDFSIVHVMNKGAAARDLRIIFKLIYSTPVSRSLGVCSPTFFFVKASSYRKFCLMLIATGALGNVIDYFIYGHVVDMFYFIFWGHSYPVFNIADSAIFMGIVLLLGETLLGKIRRKEPSTT